VRQELFPGQAVQQPKVPERGERAHRGLQDSLQGIRRSGYPRHPGVSIRLRAVI
jgi:hypothetical protein